MIFDLAAVDAALISALPALSVTAFPVLAITAGVAWWLRGQVTEDDGYGVADYAPRAVGTAAVRQPVDDRTVVIPVVRDILPPALAGPDAGSPVYAELKAAQILRELGQRARTGAAA